MIQEQYPYIDEKGKERTNLIKFYSDEGYYIKQVETGAIYEEAVDVYPSIYTYEETEEIIPKPESENDEENEEISNEEVVN